MSQPALRSSFALARPAQLLAPSTFARRCRADYHGVSRHATLLPSRGPITTGRGDVRRDGNSLLPALPVKRSIGARESRHFSGTAPICATVVRQNPRVDEDGKDMTIETSSRAAKVGTLSFSLPFF